MNYADTAWMKAYKKRHPYGGGSVKRRKLRAGGPGYYGRYQRASSTKELKFHDLDVVDSTVGNSGVILIDSCNEIAQGTGESQRIGRKVSVRSIQFRYTIRLLPSTVVTEGEDTIRIIIFQDRQANGAVTTVLSVLETADFNSFKNLSNSNRFRILMDRTHALNATAAAGDGTTSDLMPMSYQGRFYKKCNIPIEFSASGGDITTIRSNNIGILTISRTNNISSIEGKMRLRFSG